MCERQLPKVNRQISINLQMQIKKVFSLTCGPGTTKGPLSTMPENICKIQYHHLGSHLINKDKNVH